MLEKVAKYLPGLHPLAWLRDTLRMRRRVSEYAFDAAPATRAPVGVVITPWCGSAVPWLSLALGLLLAARGRRVTLVMDDTQFGEPPASWRFQLACIRHVLAAAARRVRVIELPPARGGAGPEELAEIESLATLNGVWFQRGEINVRQGAVRAIHDQLLAAHGRVRALLASEDFEAVIVPGGVWGSSGLWVHHARRRGVRVVSYDSGGYGMLLLAVDGVACQLRDIPRAMDLLAAGLSDPAERARVQAGAASEIEKRRRGTDKFASQVQGTADLDARFDGGILVALNSSWDSAALGLHLAYESTQAWLVATVRHLLEATQAAVIVRQHPVERLAIARSDDDYRALLARHFGAHPRLHFIAAEDEVNSYALLERVAGVVVYTSTFGLEATMQGRAVVTESRSYYADRGFVWQARDATEYERLLQRLAGGELVPDEAQRAQATACYYLTQCCNWVATPLNVPGFDEWSRRPLASLAGDDSVRRVLRAIDENLPVAWLNHLARAA